jgi:restriction endonuclease S subunit
MKTSIKDIANIQFGYYAQPDDLGTIPYLQAKHFGEYGLFLNQVDSFIIGNDKVNENLLKEGDILFTSKGFRVFAYMVDKKSINTIASSLFYIIKVDSHKILPQYLVSVLNTQKSIQYFKQLGAGSTIPSIRKSEVMDFEITLVSMEEQNKIISINELILKDLELCEQILKQKQTLYSYTISKLIK